IDDVFAGGGQGEMCQADIIVMERLKKGFTAIVDATLSDESVSLLYDGLVRAEGASALGDFHYVPILCCEGEKVRQVQKRLLAIYGLILCSFQGKQPARGGIITGPAGRRERGG